ncbi:hypothetical protein F5Y08DRAFT_141476 [Xylaria arbuscula]|nr:hypothetical protein F5Y08DRAFT_141476 [Xylaria arbuscula]
MGNMLESPSPKARTLDRLVGDASAAAISATLASPAIVLIDRAVVAKTASGDGILKALWTQAVHAGRRPGAFLFGRPFAIMWTLYAATYTAASFTDTLTEKYYATAATTATFLATTAVNVPLGIWKDIRYAQLFSHNSTADAKKPITASSKLPLTSPITATVPVPTPRRMPRSVTGVFLARDAITLFGSFTMAPRLATAIPDSLVSNIHAKAAVSQLTVPILTQLVATPVHLLGLDLYQRQEKGVTLSNRVSSIGPGLGGATFARCLRILPAFGFGVLANQELRSLFHTAARTA